VTWTALPALMVVAGCTPLSFAVKDGDARDTAIADTQGSTSTPSDGQDSAQPCEVWTDADGDGYGAGESLEVDCDAMPSGTAANDDDCDDAAAGVNPAATEVCNGIDDDCEGTADGGAVCPCPVASYGGHTYLFCADPVDWEQADGACSALDGYHLAVVDDAAESAWLVETGGSHGPASWWWIGYEQRSAPNSDEPGAGWQWINGSKSAFTAWHPDQPDDYDGIEDCAHIDIAHGLWNDMICWVDDWYGQPIWYVCEAGP